MSRLEHLITALAPQGVEYRTLGDVGSVVRGKRFVKDDMIEAGVPCIHYGEIYTKYGVWASESVSFVSRDRAKTLRFAQPGDVIMAAAGETVEDIGKSVAWLGDSPIAIHDACYAFSSTMDAKFVSYFFASRLFRDQIRQQISSSKISSVSTQNVAKARIPVPPLAVQHEIVRVLDQFTQLQTELQAELQARRRQFEYYRRLEMTFDSSVPRVALGEIVEVRSGWGFPNAHQGEATGEYPFYKVSDMNLLGNETVMTRANHYVSTDVAKKLGVRLAPAGTVLFPKIGAAVATNKKRVLSCPSAYDNNVMGLVPGERVTSRFLYHWMQTFDLSRLANDSGAVPSIRKSEAEQVQIPLPEIHVQQRISDLLDKFEVLVSDLTVGLPAEIAARRKQYEYYRDKMLTFEEASS